MRQQPHRRTCCRVFGFVLAGLVLVAGSSMAVDHGLYGRLLGKYVNDGVVDYQGLAQEQAQLDRYLTMLDNVDPDALSGDEQFALYVNAYNAYTIKLILEHYPVKSIKDIGGWFTSPWEIEFCKVGGETLTLDEIEHEILRPRFNDPRVHFAINCAAKSCPPLVSEPYRGETLDEQLNASTRAFINDPDSNRLEDSTLHVSRIFKWFNEDFNNDVVGFFLTYAEGDLKDQLSRNTDEIEVAYLEYDWGLNGP